MIIDKRIRAYFTGDIIMAYDPIRRHVVLVHQLLSQLNRRLYRYVLKVPVPARISLASFVSDTQLDSDTVGIAALRMFVGLRATMPGDVFILHALPDAAVKVHIVVGAGPDALTGILPAVGLRASGGADVMDYDIFDTAKLARVVIIGCQ